jgi:hypothetical protein
MAQHDYVIANGTGAAVRSDINNGLAAIVSNNSGATEPATMYAYQWWADTTTGLLKIRNAANNGWVTVGTLASANLGLLSSGSTITAALGSASTPGITFTGDTNTGIYSPGADQVAVATSGTGRLFIDSSGRALIGTSSASTATSAQYSRIQIVGHTGATEAPGRLVLRRNETSSNISLNEQIGQIFFGDNEAGEYALIECASEGTAGSGDYPGRIVLSTTADGASSPTERMRITSAGLVGIGTTSPGTELHISRATAGRVIARLADPDGRTTELRSPDNVGNTAGVGTTTNHPFVFFQNNTEAVRVDESKRLLVGTSTSRSVGAPSPYFGSIQVETTNLVPLTVVNNTNDPQPAYFLIGKSRGSIGGNTIVQNGDGIGYIGFAGADGTDLETRAASISCDVDGTPGANDMPGRLVFSTTADGSASPTERMRITSSGELRIGTTTSSASRLFVVAASNAACARLQVSANDAGAIDWHNTSGGYVASVTVGASSVSYNTTSDYRLKENIEPLTDAINRVNQLQVKRFNFILEPNKTVDGFIAHEAQAVVPECVTGEKDAVDDEGNPIYQGIDQSKLVPLLTAALQEAIAKIEALETRLSALEAA